MIYQVAITLLTLASIAQVHAASQETEWPIRIHISKPRRDSLYYVQSASRTPFSPNKTLGEMCQLAHNYNLPWCFLIANIERPGCLQTTRFFDAAIIYKFMQHHDIKPAGVLYLQIFANIIAQTGPGHTARKVTLMALNRYPSGLITAITFGEEDQLGLQLHHTVQLYDQKKHIDPTSFRQLVYNHCKRYNQLAFEQFWGEPTDAEEVERAKHEAIFWLTKYRNNPAMSNNEMDKKLSAIQAFRVLKN